VALTAQFGFGTPGGLRQPQQCQPPAGQGAPPAFIKIVMHAIG